MYHPCDQVKIPQQIFRNKKGYCYLEMFQMQLLYHCVIYLLLFRCRNRNQIDFDIVSISIYRISKKSQSCEICFEYCAIALKFARLHDSTNSNIRSRTFDTWRDVAVRHPLKTESCYDANFVVTGDNGCCRYVPPMTSLHYDIFRSSVSVHSVNNFYA